MRSVTCMWLPKSKKWRVTDVNTGERVQFVDEVMLINATRDSSKKIVRGLLIEEPSAEVFDLLDQHKKKLQFKYPFDNCASAILNKTDITVTERGHPYSPWDIEYLFSPDTLEDYY